MLLNWFKFNLSRESSYTIVAICSSSLGSCFIFSSCIRYIWLSNHSASFCPSASTHCMSGATSVFSLIVSSSLMAFQVWSSLSHSSVCQCLRTSTDVRGSASMSARMAATRSACFAVIPCWVSAWRICILSSKRICRADFVWLGTMPSGLISKKSKFFQWSRTIKYSLGRPLPNRSEHSRVPRPSICINLTFE